MHVVLLLLLELLLLLPSVANENGAVSATALLQLLLLCMLPLDVAHLGAHGSPAGSAAPSVSSLRLWYFWIRERRKWRCLNRGMVMFTCTSASFNSTS
jgi:hypothetical protein